MDRCPLQAWEYQGIPCIILGISKDFLGSLSYVWYGVINVSDEVDIGMDRCHLQNEPGNTKEFLGYPRKISRFPRESQLCFVRGS